MRRSSATGGFDWNLFGGWHLEGYFSSAREDTRTDNSNIVNTTYLAEAVGTLADNPATPFSTATSGFFNPYGDGLVNRPAILDFIRQGFSWQETRSVISSANFKADGSLFNLPGGAVRAAIGVNSRREDFDRSGEGFFSGTVPRPVNPTDARRSIGAVFGEVAIPLFGPENARPGLRRLQLSAAVRREAYSDFGSSIDPKLGIVWEPVTGASLRTSYGTSFRAPVLREVRDPLQVSFLQLRDASGALVPTVTMFGGNPDLEPERARSFSVTARWSPANNPNWRIEATWFDTRFTNRIERPAADNLTQALSNDTFSPYVTRVSPGTSADDRARVIALITSPGSVIPSVYPPEFFRAVLDARLVNAASVHVRGIDLLASGSFALGEGRGSLQVNASHLIDFRRQITPNAAEIERVGTIGNPPAWRVRGTAGYDSGTFGMSLTANHVAGYVDDISRPARPVTAWTTLDAQVRLQPKIFGMEELSLAFNVQNLFDQDPPFVDQNHALADAKRFDDVMGDEDDSGSLFTMERAQQQLLGDAHARMRRHLEGAQLEQATATAGAVGREHLVDAELGAVGVAGGVDQQVARGRQQERGGTLRQAATGGFVHALLEGRAAYVERQLEPDPRGELQRPRARGEHESPGAVA